eukprot:scaffold3720_cov141-Cylindrotheca_fusiformis.AAC.11
MERPSYKLYTPQGSFRAFSPLIAAQYNNIGVDVVTDNIEEAVRLKSPTGKAPFLENVKTGEVIFSSHAIARYIGSLRQDGGLMGRDFHEVAKVNYWLDWCQQDVELTCCIIFYPVAGYIPKNELAQSKAENDLRAALEILDKQLSSQKFLVAEDQITMADIVLVCALLYPFKLALDEEYLKPFKNVVCWFQKCTARLEFVSVLGNVEMYKK